MDENALSNLVIGAAIEVHRSQERDPPNGELTFLCLSSL